MIFDAFSGQGMEVDFDRNGHKVTGKSSWCCSTSGSIVGWYRLQSLRLLVRELYYVQK